MNLARLRCALEIILEGHLISAFVDIGVLGAGKTECAVHFPWFATELGKTWIRNFARLNEVFVHVDREHCVTLYGPNRKDTRVLALLYAKLVSLAVGKNQNMALVLMEKLYQYEASSKKNVRKLKDKRKRRNRRMRKRVGKGVLDKGNGRRGLRREGGNNVTD